MPKAALFDWGDTLVRAEWSEEIAKAGTLEGLAAVARRQLPSADKIGGWFQERTTDLFPAGHVDEVDLVDVCRRCFRDLGCQLSNDELERYLEASNRYWWSRYDLHPHAHRVLDTLRQRGVELAIVSNSATPRRFLDHALRAQGLMERVDVAVFSCEVGKRKPHPAIFRAALDALAVDPRESVFVGDRLYEDILGAGQLGITTVQALWFRQDEHSQGGTPHFRAQQPLDLLDFVGA